MLQNAAKKATPSSEPHRATNNVSYEIKRLIAEKRKARSTWQRTHTHDNMRKYNQISNKLKFKPHELRNESFKAYVSRVKREDRSIWKPIKNRRKPTESQPPIRKNTIPPGPWAKSDKEKADLFAEHLSEVFTPHNSVQKEATEYHTSSLNLLRSKPTVRVNIRGVIREFIVDSGSNVSLIQPGIYRSEVRSSSTTSFGVTGDELDMLLLLLM